MRRGPTGHPALLAVALLCAFAAIPVRALAWSGDPRTESIIVADPTLSSAAAPTPGPTPQPPGDQGGPEPTPMEDDAPSVTVDPAEVVEGNAGTSQLVFPVRLVDGEADAQTVSYRTTVPATRHQATPGEDYVPANGTITVAPGQVVPVTVVVRADTTWEPDEDVRLEVVDPDDQDGSVEDPASGLIRNDDPFPGVSPGPPVPAPVGAPTPTPTPSPTPIVSPHVIPGVIPDLDGVHTGGGSAQLVPVPNAPGLAISPGTVDFGSYYPGMPPRTVTLANPGTGYLHLYDIRLAGQDEGTAFTLERGCGEGLEPRTSCTLTVSYAPYGSYVSYVAQLDITNDADARRHVDHVTLQGTVDGVRAPAPAPSCPTQLPSPADRLLLRPVILVHGWSGDPAGMTGLATKIEASAPHTYAIYCYDYSQLTQIWPNDTHIHQGLANAIATLSVAYKRGGGDGRVLAAGHSMGGIAIRWASGDNVHPQGIPDDQSIRIGDVPAGVVTLGTPHQGSPWARDQKALVRVVEWTTQMLRGVKALPPEGGDAAACLRPPTDDFDYTVLCGKTPDLPANVPIAQLGTQITLRRTLFEFGILKSSTDMPLFGDGIVPTASSTGYTGSGTGATFVAACPYDTDYLFSATSGAVIGAAVGGPLGAIVGGVTGVATNQALDKAAQADIAKGEASQAVFVLTTQVLKAPCFHTQLTTYFALVDELVKRFKEFADRSSGR